MDTFLTGPLASLHVGPAPQAPPRPSTLGRSLLSTLALAVALGWAAQVIELRPLELIRDLGNIGVFLKGYLNPSFARVELYAWQCVITLCIALWGTVMAVANQKLDVASTNLSDIQQMTMEGKIPRGAVRVIWVSKLIPNDPIVVRKDLPDNLKQAIQQSLTAMRAANPEAFAAGGAWIGGFVKVDDVKYQIIRDLNETAKRLAAPK